MAGFPLIQKREKEEEEKETKKVYHLNQIKGLTVDFGNPKALDFSLCSQILTKNYSKTS